MLRTKICRRLTFVMHTTTGTLNANEMAKCSFDIPMSPALPPTIKITQDGDPDVRPYRVVFRYRSCPARSKTMSTIAHGSFMIFDLPLNEMILEACIEISSHPIFSRRMTSGSLEWAVDGSMGFPVGPNPRICIKNENMHLKDVVQGRTSMPTLEVLPLSISCLCLNKLTRARPRPSSNWPGRHLDLTHIGVYARAHRAYLLSRRLMWLTCRYPHSLQQHNELPEWWLHQEVVIARVALLVDGLFCCHTILTSSEAGLLRVRDQGRGETKRYAPSRRPHPRAW